MRAKSYLSSAQLKALQVLKHGGYLVYWEEIPEVNIVSITEYKKGITAMFARFDMRTFDILKKRGLIKKDRNIYLREIWRLNKNGQKNKK